MKKHTATSLWWNFIVDNRWVYLLGIFSVMVTNTCQVLIPRIMGEIVDHIHLLGSTEILMNLSLLYFFTHGILAIGRYGWRRTLACQTHYSYAWLKEKIWDHAKYFSMDRLQGEFTPGVLMNNSTSDVGQSRFIFGFTLVALCDVVFLGTFVLLGMFSIHWKMTLATLVLFPFLPLLIKKLADREGRNFFTSQEYLSKLNDKVAESIATIKTQRLTQGHKYWEEILNKKSDAYRKRRERSLLTSLEYIPTMGVGTILSYLILFVWGIWGVFNGELSIGEFVVMEGYIILLQDPMIEIGLVISEFQRGRTGLARLANIFNTPKDELISLEGRMYPEGDTALEVKNLKIDIEGKEILSNLSFTLKKGERLGIVGDVGKGKSVLLNALARFCPFKGEALLFGRPIEEFSHDNIRKHIAFVPQKAFLFADTLRENLQLDQKFSEEELWSILDIVQMKSEIKELPNGLDTELGEWGINLSGGQKQRLVLAQVLLRKSPIIFLDDCLSAVDTVTEEKILQSLNAYFKEQTLIWVAHRKSTLKYCHRILELS